ncbi:hypothetical protein Mapa_018669 [Marchantia paleacea]|nr:hypothetical protein Mapa_018669 [Marchantia paleacea]
MRPPLPVQDRIKKSATSFKSPLASRNTKKCEGREGPKTCHREPSRSLLFLNQHRPKSKSEVLTTVSLASELETRDDQPS